MTEALPVGNGFMGAMIFGGIEQEHIQFTEGTLWSGGPGSNPEYNFGNREVASKYLLEVRQLLQEGNREEAHRLASRLLTGVIHQKDGGPAFGDYGAQQTRGDLYVQVEQSGAIKNYRRELNLPTGKACVSYQAGKVKHQRTFFGSYTDKLMVYQFKNSATADYEISYISPHLSDSVEFNGQVVKFKGRVEDNNMEFETCLQLKTDGEIVYNDGQIWVKKASELTICHLAATDYTLEYPHYKGNDLEEIITRYYRL
ncbi:MAG: glycoside hydrolase family 95 protein [Marinilabiliaceae bacterium]|nr:glycoside hydrolase family 95 protein [Marinilabiliaceae bacterium]